MQDINSAPKPQGKLMIQVLAERSDTDIDGDMYGGWLLAQMDKAALTAAMHRAEGRVAMVSVENMTFMNPVYLGDVVSCFTNIGEVGRSSIPINVEVWTNLEHNPVKVTDGTFVYVAIDKNHRTRAVPK